MTDEEFLARFERCELDGFAHRDHVRLAWIELRAWGRDAALARVRDGIRRFAAHHGAAGKYHETMTVGWLALVASALTASPDEPSFEAFLAANPRLLESALLLQHYSPEALARGRDAWVEPDLRPIG